ncbi:hypothetical protein [Nonomuraea sp. NPDC050783]|uniref:hypothetical protein n=1 Tax=Nonomuraea sp. NPDC050783 TaxID=3154634 RepID=UPI003466D3F5
MDEREMEIHKEVFRSAADAFDAEGNDLGRFIGAAARDLEAIGAFWGDDKLGATFAGGEGGGSGYVAVTGQIMEGTDVLVSAHRQIAQRLRLMRDGVQVADWSTIATVLAMLPPADPERPIWGAG